MKIAIPMDISDFINACYLLMLVAVFTSKIGLKGIH